MKLASKKGIAKVGEVEEGRTRRLVSLTTCLLVAVLAGLMASSPAALAAEESSGISDQRIRQTVYSGPFMGGKGTGVGLFRRAGTVRVQVYGACTSVVSPRIQVRNRKVVSSKIFRAFGRTVRLRIQGRFSKNQLVFSGRLKMTSGGVDCTGYGKGSFPKFKARKETFR